MTALALLAAAAAASAAPAWENPAVNSENRLPARTYSMPLADEAAALSGEIDPATPFRKSLNGVWKISWAGDPALRVKDFWQAGFDDADWLTVDVPSCLELRGFGSPGYVNWQYPHAWDPKRDIKCPTIRDRDTDRAAGYLTVTAGHMAMAANLYILGPGSPFLYYGEEIGMRGSRGSANTDADRRLAMLWGDGDTVKDPEGSSYQGQTDSNVAEQLAKSDSLLSHYKRLIMLRQANPEIARGDYTAVSVPDSKVGGFVATLDGSSVLVLHNTTPNTKTVDLSALGLDFHELSAVIGREEASLDGTTLTIGGLTSVILR